MRRLIVQAGGFTKIEGKPSLAEKIMRKIFIWITNEAAMIAGNDEMAEFWSGHAVTSTGRSRAQGRSMSDASDPIEAAHDYGSGMPSDKIGKIDLTRQYVDLLSDGAHTKERPLRNM